MCLLFGLPFNFASSALLGFSISPGRNIGAPTLLKELLETDEKLVILLAIDDPQGVLKSGTADEAPG